MKILASQLVMSLAVLAFAMVALRIAGALPGNAQRYGYAWELTGWTFLLAGSNSLFHDLFSIIAFQGGAESQAWAAVLRWHPILNHSRTFLLTAYCLALVVALYRLGRDETAPPLRWTFGVAVMGMIIGGAVGWLEEAFSGLSHYSAVAVFDIMELGAFMLLLIVGLSSGSMDRSLWGILSVNGFVLALSVLLFAALSRIDLAGQWTPRPWHVQSTKALLRVLMVALALRQLWRLRHGHPVRGLLESTPRPATTPSLHG